MVERTPAGPVRERLIDLVELGNSIQQIAQACNEDATGLMAVFRGERQKISARKAAAVMALPLEQVGEHELSEPLVRRLRALAALGHSQATVAAAAGIRRDVINEIHAGQWRRVRDVYANAIRAAYETLREEPGINRRTRDRAFTEQWPPPQAWNETDLNDIDPMTTTRVTKAWFSKAQPPSEGMRLRIARLAHDYTLQELAAKMGISLDTLRAWENDRYLPPARHHPRLRELLAWTPTKEEPRG